MSVVDMKLVSIIGFIDEIDSVASACSSCGIFEPDNVDLFFENSNKFTLFSNKDDSTSLISDLDNISKKIGKKIEHKDIKCTLNKRQISRHISFLNEKCDKAISKLERLKLQLKTNSETINSLVPFEKVNQKVVEFKSCEYLKTKFVKIPKLNIDKLKSIENYEDKILIVEISEEENFFYCVVFISEEFYEEFLEISSKIQFTEFKISNLSLTPKEEIERLKNENANIKEIIKKTNEGIEKFWKYQQDICSGIYNRLKFYEENEKVKKYAKIYNNNFIIVGWIPFYGVSLLTDKLKKISRVEYSVESGQELLKFSPPTKLENRKIVSPFEFFVSTYGLPKYSDIDPTTFVAITYTIIFGIMFADVGQGIALSLVGYFLSKFKKVKLGKIMSICGISSSFFGLIFGSVFGFEHLLDPIYEKINFYPIRVMESTMTIIISSISIGIISLILAMCVNIYSNMKKNDKKEAIFSHSGLCGIFLYSSLITLISSQFVNTKSELTTFCVAIVAISSVLIFLKKAIKKNFKVNWKNYVLTQFFEMFDVFLGYFTNTISFVRIGVFIFVHAGMMMVVFSLANGLSPVGYTLTVIAGNIFVTCFEAFLVGMQVMRLQFCELFGRFFEGGGREFKPVSSTIKNN